MKKYIQLSVLLFSALLIVSCNKKIKPSSEITTETTKLESYDRVVISSAIDVDLTFTSDMEEVVVEANANLHKHIVKKVKNGTLYIRLEDNIKYRNSFSINVHLYAKTIVEMEVSGASTLKLKNACTADDLKIKLTGASEFSGELNVENLNLSASGAAEVDVYGVSSDCQLDLSGASTFENVSYSTNVLKAELSGASDLKIKVNTSLSLDLSGASSVRYAGEGNIVDLNSSGSSTVEHI